MYIYHTPYEPPRMNEIVEYRMSPTIKPSQISDWEEFVESRGEVVFKILCEDGLVICVRLSPEYP